MPKWIAVRCCAVAGAVALTGALLAPRSASAAAGSTAAQGTSAVVDGLAGPTGEAVSGTNVWITDRSGNSLTEITDTGRLVRQVSGAADRLVRPGPIVASPGALWVASRSGLTEVAASTGALIRTIPTRALHMRRPVVALVTAGSDVLAVGSGGAVAAIATGSGRVVASATSELTRLVGPSAAVVAGADLWVTSTGNDTLVELRARDLSRLRTVSAAAGGLDTPDGITFDGTHLWVADGGSYAVSELTSTGGLVRVVSDATGPYGFDQPGAMLHWGGYVFVVSPPGSSPMVTQVATSNGHAEWYMCNTNGPYHFADPTALAIVRGRLWVANPADNSLTEMNATSGALIQTIP